MSAGAEPGKRCSERWRTTAIAEGDRSVHRFAVVVMLCHHHRRSRQTSSKPDPLRGAARLVGAAGVAVIDRGVAVGTVTARAFDSRGYVITHWLRKSLPNLCGYSFCPVCYWLLFCWESVRISVAAHSILKL